MMAADSTDPTTQQSSHNRSLSHDDNDMNSNNNNSLREALLAATPLSPSADSTRSKYVTLASMSGRGFSEDFDDDDDDDDAMSNDSSQQDREKTLQLVLLSILGRPYANDQPHAANFWCRLLPLSILSGVVLGVLSMVYLGCIHWVLVTVFMPQFLLRQNSNSDLPIEQQLLLQQGDTGTIQWVLVTTLGGFASAAVLLCRGAPDPGSVRNIFHDIHDLKVSIDLCIYMCVHTHESENERLLLAVVLVVVVCGAMISTGRILTVPNRRRAFPPPCCTQL